MERIKEVLLEEQKATKMPDGMLERLLQKIMKRIFGKEQEEKT